MNALRVFVPLLFLFSWHKFGDSQEEDPSCVPRQELKEFGDTYDGFRTITINGVKCMKWSLSAYFPIEEDVDYEFYEVSLEYCRGFHFRDNAKYGPWCFIDVDDDPKSKKIYWEPCFRACDDVDRKCVRYIEIPFTQNSYLGDRNIDIDGRSCLKWNKVYNDDYYGSWDHNYCRAGPLIGNLASLDRPKVPWCVGEGNKWQQCFENCHDIATCMDPKETTLPYKGGKAKTVNGHDCDTWTNPDHPLFNKYPATKADQNYCRNFGRLAIGPFCLVPRSNPEGVLIEACFDHCEDLAQNQPCVGPDKKRDYWGTRHVTLSGVNCQRWDKTTPNLHTFKPEDLGADELWEVSNFCRNPDSSLDGPWCFTSDLNPTREKCFEKCSGYDRIGNDSKVITMTPADYIPEGGESLTIIWLIFGIIIVVLFCMCISDFFCRNWCIRMCNIDAELEECQRIIENYRPGKPGSPKATKIEAENWMKLVDNYHKLKKQKQYAVERIS